MKRLIVNADDLGADQARNAGIFEAIEASSVTSVSLLPNGPALDDAVQRIHALKGKCISWGVHLNLSEGAPLSPGLRALTGPGGRLLGKKPARRLLTRGGGAALLQEVRAEIEAQILCLKDRGVPISHLDGHQHVHVFPAVVSAAAAAAKAHGIPWVRIPEEIDENGWDHSPLSANAEEARLFSGHAAVARPLFQAMGVYTTDHFKGLFLKGRLPASDWIEFLDSIPNGLSEFMVHPGYAARDESIENPFARFSTIDREKELSALTDGRFLEALARTGVELTPFPESWQA